MREREMLAAAVRYAGMGWHVFPVNPQTKRPFFKDNLARATVDEREIRDWWRHWPMAAIGVACGPSGIYVVDPDAGIGREMSLPALLDAHGDGFLETVTHESGGGGLGMYYWAPDPPLRNFQGSTPGREAEPLRPGPLGVGIDGRGDGGYIIVPPSSHPSGERYECLLDRSPFDMEPAPMPEWMRERIAGRAWEPGGAETLAETVIARARSAVEAGSGRNDAAFWAACQLRDNGHDAASAEGALVADFLPGLRPTNTKGERERFGERDIAATVASAFRRSPREAWKEAAATENSFSHPKKEAVEERILKFTTARDFASSIPPSIPWVAPGYLARGAITEVGGKVKRAGKTTLMLAACAAIVRGEPFLGQKTERTGVVYLTEQVGASFREALRRAGLLESVDVHILSWAATAGVEWEAVAGQAAGFALSVGAGLLVVDTLPQFARIGGDDENSAGAAMAAMGPLQEAAARGLAVAVVRHERKSGGDVGDSTRGSSAFAGAADIVLAVRRPEGTAPENVRVIYGLSRFDETPAELAVELAEDGRYRVVGDASALSARLTREALLRELPGDEEAAVDTRALQEATGTGASRALAELVREGLAMRKGKGVKGSPYLYWRSADSILSSPIPKEEERNEGVGGPVATGQGTLCASGDGRPAIDGGVCFRCQEMSA